MVYIDKKDEEITVKSVFPRTKSGEIEKIVFVNQLDKSKITITNFEVETSLNFYEIEFKTNTFVSGQYDYTIFGPNNVKLGTGICEVDGFIPSEMPTYATEDKNIIQYNG